MNIRRGRNAGVTLLEMIFVAAFAALILGLGFELLTSAQQISLLQQEQSAASRDAWVFVHRISKELREAIPPAETGGEGRWRGASASVKLLEMVSPAKWPDVSLKEFQARQVTCSNDTIEFCTLHVPSANLAPVPGVVEYSLRRGERNDVVNIVRRAAPLGVPLEKGETEVIGPVDPESSLGFVSLRFEYLDAKGQWRGEWTEEKSMPSAVRVSVSTLLRPSRQLRVPVINQYSTQVDLPTDTRIPQ